MSTEPTMAGGPRRLQVATLLTTLRKRAALTKAAVGEATGFGTSTVHRYEDWRSPVGIRWQVVRDIAHACGATDDEIEPLIRLAKETRTSGGWWVDNGAVPPWMSPLVLMEDQGEYEHVFAPLLIPGLLQTREYALAVHQRLSVRVPSGEIEAMVETRMQRQSVLTRTPPLHVWVVLGEAALRQVVGGPEVMGAQINHLCEVAQEPNIDIQILPFAAGAHAAGMSHFVLLGAGGGQMRVAYVETLTGGLYHDKESEVAPHTIAFEYLRAQALSQHASAAFMAAARKELL
ncbi:helix-turn-helix domain-containing protein [Embleya sp. MST-111070]|uniref:helix-turn-helix domain-containing protein n=1 Tax=Embleya sp. MST-111070 TaxID=3398231 RepID=UPI003F73D611